MKRSTSALLILAMLLTMALSLTACVTEKIVYVTESKEEVDDDEKTESAMVESTESAQEDMSETNSETSEETIGFSPITAEEFIMFFEEKGFSAYWENDQKTRAKVKNDSSVEIDFDVYADAEEARYEFMDCVSELFGAYDNDREQGEIIKMTENFACLSRWEDDGATYYVACAWARNTVLIYLCIGEDAYSAMIEDLTALGYYE